MPPGNLKNPILCGDDVADDRCIDAAEELFCRVAPRVLACCGDALCEGAETPAGVCDVDCIPLPEPGAHWLWASGIGLLWLLGRRGRRV